MKVAEPKACFDVTLGAIALLSRTRMLDEYVDVTNSYGKHDCISWKLTREIQCMLIKIRSRPDIVC